MKNSFKKVSTLLLTLVLTFGFTSSNVLAAENLKEANKINAVITEELEFSPNDTLEKVKVAEFDAKDLKIGDNEIYNDGETVISLRVEVPVESMIRPLAGGDSGWSSGWIDDTATLYPYKKAGTNEIGYELFWYDYSIDSVHSLDYRVGNGEVTDVILDIIRATPGSSYASAIGEVRYVVHQAGLVVGSYNNWLRTDINRSGQVRTVWNY